MEFSLELLSLGAGSAGLALALLYILLRKSKKTSEIHSKFPLDPKQSANAIAAIQDSVGQSPTTLLEAAAPTTPLATQAPLGKKTWWDALSKTRAKFSFSKNTEISDLKSALEEACIVSDLGVQNTQEAFEKLSWTELGSLKGEDREAEAKKKLSQVFLGWLNTEAAKSPWPAKGSENPTVIWFVGVNGVGKTTSIAKLGQEIKNSGFSVLFAAGDTFRAGAAEQLEVWAERLDIPCVKGQAGGDSSAVLFDAIQSAKAKNIDFVLCDSAGRLHNQGQLMEALAKNKRVMDKALPGAPHEVLLVLDANTGQNMLRQAEEFLKSVGVTGLILTKLDGSARGGAVVAVARKTHLPIRRLGLGESPEDFSPFEAQAFADALLGIEGSRASAL